jgi:hypothetical protein
MAMDPCAIDGAPAAVSLAKDEDELRAELRQAVNRQANCADKPLMRKELTFTDALRCWSRSSASLIFYQKLPSGGDPNRSPWLTAPVSETDPLTFFLQGQFSAHTAAEALLKKQDVCLKLQMPKYTSAGVGRYGDIWVLMLATDPAHP